MTEKIYAVLTGDIVRSRALSAEQLKALQRKLKSAAADFESSFPGTVIGDLGITRGDGWQVALGAPERAFRLAVFLRVVVKSGFGTDTRVSIGVGTAERLEPDHIVESSGPVFERSGHGLEGMHKKRFLAWTPPELPARLESAELLLVSWLDALITPVSVKQAALLKHMLLNKKQEQAAQALDLVQSTVSEGLAASRWNEIRAILNHFDEYR